MKISVVVPLYNKAPYIGEAVASLAAQTLLPHELIVVDDASEDDSLESLNNALVTQARALRSSRIQVIRQPSNKGPGHARNVGMAAASGDWIMFLDADDAYEPSSLSKVRWAAVHHQIEMLVLGFTGKHAERGVLERFPSEEALEGELRALEHDLQLMMTPAYTASSGSFFMGRASNVAVSLKCVAGRRYDETISLNEGIDFWYQVLRGAALEGRRIGLCTAPLIRFRLLEDSLSHRPRGHWREIAVPPSVTRYLESSDKNDQRLVAMLAERWHGYALDVLQDPRQRKSFLEHHQVLLQRLGLGSGLTSEFLAQGANA